MLLALLRFPKDDPVAVLPPGVVSRLPLRVDDWALADLHDAVTRHEARLACGVYQLDVGPLVTVVVHVVGDLAEQYAFFLQYAIGFTHERRERVSKRVMVLFR